MKVLKNILRNISAFFRTIVRFIDKKIVVPISKFLILISEKTGKNSKVFEKWLTKKNTLTFISLILAILFFFLVDSKSLVLVESSAEVLYNQKVTAIYNAESYVVEGLPETVDITLIGRTSDLYLAKQLPAQEITVDLSSLKPSPEPQKVALKYKNAINSIEYKLDPSSVTVMIYPKVSETRLINVDVLNQDELDQKLFIQNVEIDRTDVIIKSNEETLKKVATVKALVDVNNIIDPEIGVSNLNDIPLIAYDSKGQVVDVEIVPEKVSATISIVSPSAEVPLKIIPTGELQFGKAISSITSELTKVVVYGDENVIKDIQFVPVEIDVTDLGENKEFNIILTKPQGIRYMNATNTTVHISVGNEITREVQNVQIETINLDTNYKVIALGESSSMTSVILKGTDTVLNDFDISTLKATIDLSGYGIGDHEVDVQVSGDDVKINYAPKTKKVRIRISQK